MIEQNKQFELYIRNMYEIKYRIKAVKDIRLRSTTVSRDYIHIEFVVLQIRKILELIALSSLVSDYNIYERHFRNIQRQWKADLIIKDIEKINPKFYPEPTVTIKRDDGYDELIKSPKDYLNKERFIKVYEKCGRILHAINPVIGEKNISNMYKEYDEYIDEWLEWITNLLENHTVQLYDSDLFLYIVMGDESHMPSGNVCKEDGNIP